jgi:hypothetical protein
MRRLYRLQKVVEQNGENIPVYINSESWQTTNILGAIPLKGSALSFCVKINDYKSDILPALLQHITTMVVVFVASPRKYSNYLLCLKPDVLDNVLRTVHVLASLEVEQHDLTKFVF